MNAHSGAISHDNLGSSQRPCAHKRQYRKKAKPQSTKSMKSTAASKAAIPQEGKISIDEKHEINSSKAAIPQEGKKSIDEKHEINSSIAAIP
jgi:hypothetical protein